MKLIHLSDLHIGKRVNEVSMITEQAYILNQITDIIDAEQPQCVLICGDVYDKTVPSAEAVALLDDFLCRLARRRLTVLIISGNHDSPERLAFGGRLMAETGIHISPVYSGTVTPVTLADAHGEVHFWLLPFVKPAHVKRFYPEESIESYTDALRIAIGKMEIDSNQRNVLLTHQFVTGSATCDSEERSVGGSDNVDAAVFAGFDYVALGHIHGPQNIGSERIRYCGTPLKYSFSEAHHKKSVCVIELEEKGTFQLRTVPLIPCHDLREIRGSYEEVTAKPFYENTPVEDYLHITLTDEEDVPEAMARLRVIYPNLMKLSYDNTRTRSSAVIDSAADVQHKSPLQLFGELYQLQNNQPMSDIQQQYLLELIEDIWEGNP
nr:exonuclease SbcCD subunit D [Oscillospiraceae bacterium]